MTIKFPKKTLMMVLCGYGMAFAAAADAAPIDVSVMSLSVKYDPQLLDTDSGAKVLYRRLVKASEEVCPDTSSQRFVSAAIQSCRTQALAQAVHRINNPRLAAIDSSLTRKG